MRKLQEYVSVGTKRLRCGYTTGTCAAAAARAATELLCGRAVEAVMVETPAGIPITVEVEDAAADKGWAQAAVRKDAGDDPDVTDGILVCARVELVDEPGIRIEGGEGVGRVTQPGLDQPVGEAAINSVPRRMIREQVEAALENPAFQPEPMSQACHPERSEGSPRSGLDTCAHSPQVHSQPENREQVEEAPKNPASQSESTPQACHLERSEGSPRSGLDTCAHFNRAYETSGPGAPPDSPRSDPRENRANVAGAGRLAGPGTPPDSPRLDPRENRANEHGDYARMLHHIPGRSALAWTSHALEGAVPAGRSEESGGVPGPTGVDVEEPCSTPSEIGVLVTVSVPGGEEVARKTFNPRLGIEGGISIIGTSGIVRPMSEEALVASIELEMRVLAERGVRDLLVVPGNYGRDFAEKQLGVSLEDAVQCSNFFGTTIDSAVRLGFTRMLIVGHIGKMAKVAGGIMHTHSRMADCRVEVIAAHAALAGAGRDVVARIMGAATTDAALDALAEAELVDATMESLMASLADKLAHRAGDALLVEAIVFSNVHGILGQTPRADELLAEFRKHQESRG